MAEIRGTPGKDVVTVKSGDRYHGEEGDDTITIEAGGTGQGMAGNDTLIVPAGVAANAWASVWYWSSPGTIFVDMEAGYALDGFGGRDTLVNVHNVHGFQRNGDKGYGTSTSDYFYLGSNWSRQGGLVYIDGRGGSDKAFIGYKASDNFGALVLQVSVDGRTIKLYTQNYPNFIYELHNIEAFAAWDQDTQTNVEYDLAALRDLSRAGEEILLRGYKGFQKNAPGTPTTLTYSFLTKAPLTGGEGGAGFTAFSAAQQQTVRDILYVLQQQTGLAFAEVSGDTGQLKFAINQQTATRGYSFIPDANKGDAKSGGVWLDVETAALMQPGQEGYYVLLHELAHALGLQHPLNESDTSGATVLLNSLATSTNTLMLDISSSSAAGVWPTWFGGFDLQALRALYGTRSFGMGNDVYALADGSPNMSILDDGGIDTLDASAASISATIDLRPGKTSSIGLDTGGRSKFNNVAISNSTYLENVVGTLYDDVIIGNSQNNLITYTGGNDFVDGKEGVDILRIWANASSSKIQKDMATGYWNLESVNGETGNLEIQNTERIFFADKYWALDTAATESAARTAKILGAIFGKAGVSNLEFRGIGLFYFDRGMGYEALTQLAIDARLGPGASKAAVTQLVQANVPGLLMNPNDYASPAALGVAAAESTVNAAMVNLTGLSSLGMEYLFFGS